MATTFGSEKASAESHPTREELQGLLAVSQRGLENAEAEIEKLNAAIKNAKDDAERNDLTTQLEEETQEKLAHEKTIEQISEELAHYEQ